jgi:hypothetical protein
MERRRVPQRRMPRPWLLPTGTFIRDYLLDHGESYPQEIWRALREERTEMELKYGSYQSFRSNYIYVLKRLGLIEPTRRVPGRPGMFDRQMYRIVPGMERDPRWRAPQKYLDPRRGIGSRRYKRTKRP